MTQIFPIHAYLSYRCRNDIDITARDHLASLCQQQHITLKYDENETKDGDSLIAFMAELTSARVVFIFLSPAYFQSAYTLFELVTIAEQAEIDKRFILPIRLTESMNTYQLTEAKEYFDNNIKISNELARLLTTEANPEQLWQRIDKAWQALIFPVLDKVSLSFENQEEPAVTQLLKNTQEEITAAIKRSTTELQQTLIQKITSILELNNINADAQWQEELGLSTNNNKQNIAKQLIENTEVGEALAIITRIVEEKDRRSADWIACIEDAIQLASWCLLNSVDPVWWFHQQIRLKNTSKISIINQVTLNNENYIEVVIARSLLQKPEYVLDKNYQPAPRSKTNEVLLFDSTSSEATKQVLLTKIYLDLYKIPPSGDIDLITTIATRAKTHHKTRKGKFIYYLVSADFLNILKNSDWYPEAEKQLAGYLQFISIEKKQDKLHGSTENQYNILDQLAYLMSLAKDHH